MSHPVSPKVILSLFLSVLAASYYYLYYFVLTGLNPFFGSFAFVLLFLVLVLDGVLITRMSSGRIKLLLVGFLILCHVVTFFLISQKMETIPTNGTPRRYFSN